MVEEQETLTVKEFKAWLVGLIRGKNGTLPNLDDWKVIKMMLDKIQDEPDEKVVYVEKESSSPYPWDSQRDPQRDPWRPPYRPHEPWTTPSPSPITPYVGDYLPNQKPMIWCSNSQMSTGIDSVEMRAEEIQVNDDTYQFQTNVNAMGGVSFSTNPETTITMEQPPAKENIITLFNDWTAGAEK